MYDNVMAEMDKARAAIKASGRLFMYAEDWVYAPAVTKIVEERAAAGHRPLSCVRGVRAAILHERGVLFANITPNNHMTSYLTDEKKFAGVYITEKVDRKTGWPFICLEEEWTRGYLQEIQDFMECVAVGRQPSAGLGLGKRG